MGLLDQKGCSGGGCFHCKTRPAEFRHQNERIIPDSELQRILVKGQTVGIAAETVKQKTVFCEAKVGLGSRQITQEMKSSCHFLGDFLKENFFFKLSV
ncbi:hypothetical protein [Deinococcus roseus]|uniref:hypothetical protein n=1 Tax=Deinococcus roseus TaxID=392414 RepID=UPI001663FF03|nr:hypothetical protein [Deinococcus roseus]